MKKCINCGKELLDDSLFCQYCGSDKIETIEKIVFKRCIDCGKELPSDSDFCQYCGSKRVAIVNKSLSNDKTYTAHTNANEKRKIKPVYMVLAIIIVLFVGIVIFENIGKPFENAETIIYNNYFEYGDYMFDVQAPKNESVYVYIKSKYSDKCISYLVKENCEVTVYLKSGDYSVYYAVGKHWHGEVLKFGLFTKYYIDKANFRTYDLPDGYGWITCFEPLDDSIYEIKASEFPK